MPDPSFARDEALFWLGQQDREHMHFLFHGIEEPSIREEAARLAKAYEAAAKALDARQLLAVARPAQALKTRALEATRAGWTGSLYPSMIEHMWLEVDHAIARMSRPFTSREIAWFWVREREGVAHSVAKLLDPSEGAASAEGMRHAAALRDLGAACRRSLHRPDVGDPTLSVLGATAALARYVDKTTARRPASILHPAWLQHEAREGQRAEAQLLALSQAAQGR